MKLLITGPNWFGNNVEYCKNAFSSFGYDIKVFYYNDSQSNKSFEYKKRIKRILLSSSNSFGHLIADFYKALKKQYEKRQVVAANLELIKSCNEFKPNAIFILKGETIYKETIEQLIKKGIAVYYWWFDNPFEYAKTYEYLLDNFKMARHVFIIEPYYINLLGEAGINNVSYLGNGCEPLIYSDVKLSIDERKKYECELSFVGTCYPRRYQILKNLMNYHLKIYGVQWFNYFNPEIINRTNTTIVEKIIAPEMQAKIFVCSKINLNFHRPNLITSSNQRTFEIACAGGFQLVHYKKLISEEFCEDREIVYYFDLNDLKDKIDYYLKNEDKRIEVAANAKRKCLDHFTYKKRIEGILQYIQ
tara:strand:+ start:84 stop:1163 length:1080 start_codon:yes stop_codon:yes gene_type:complete